MKKNRAMFSYLFGEYLKASPYLNILQLVLVSINGLLPVIQMIVTSHFINVSISYFSANKNDNSIYIYIFLLVLIVGYNWLSGNILNMIQTKINLSVRYNLSISIMEKCSKLKYYHIEDPETADLIHRISTESSIKFTDGYANLLSMILSNISICGSLVYIVANSWALFVIIIIMFIPLVVLSAKSGKYNYEQERQISILDRKCVYLSDILTQRETVDERTLFQFSDHINQCYDDTYKQYTAARISTSIKWYVKTKLGGLLSVLIGFASLFVLVQSAMEGNISVGILISITSSIFAMSNQLSWQVSGQIDSFILSREYLVDLFTFFNLSEVKHKVDKAHILKEEVESIEFVNVSFKYPNTVRVVLNNLSFKLEKSQHYSFVGSNGAGKTTVVKILTKLYDNYSGEIFINGVNLKDYDVSSIRRMFSVVFQDFARYSLTIYENCKLGNNVQYNKELIDDIVDDSLKSVDLYDYVYSLPKAKDTMLGKISEEGVDFSGGQWQRLTLARSIVSTPSVRILDEPTASIDPISESKLFELFNRRYDDTLSIFISHRLGSTKNVDKIFVLQDGVVIEQGNHNELIQRKGVYADMFEKQRGWYK